MKWLLTADLQFDSFETYSTQTAGGITSRLQDMIVCWDSMMTLAVKNGCKGIIAVGDIFDSRTTLDLPVLDQVCRAVHRAAEHKLEVHIVAGNHDSYLRSPLINSLQVFKGMAMLWDKAGTDGELGFLPWTEDTDEFKKNARGLARLGAKFLFAHVLCQGAVHAAAGGIAVADLSPELYAGVYLGDVHEPIELTKKVRYIGSPMQLDYGDAGGKRGCRILDTKTGKDTWHENTWSPRFHILTTPAVEGVKQGDFVRIKTDDAEIAAMTRAKLTKLTQWVETTYVESTDTKPRVDVRSSQEHREILERYCAFKGIEDAELIEVGLELLEKAKGKS